MPDKLYQECRAVMSGCRAIFEDLLDSGIDQLPLVSNRSSESGVEETLPIVAQVAQTETRSEDSFALIQQELAHCSNCGLESQRKQVLFGVGNPKARLVLVGEDPDVEEDEQGLPFVGQAGQLLDRILFAMKLTRAEVYICNLIKCRTSPDCATGKERFAACETFLKRQLAIISPEIILSLGPFATQALLQTGESLTQLRGRWQNYAGIPLMPTFHPAFLLQNPTGKHQVWEDVKQVMHRLQDVG